MDDLIARLEKASEGSAELGRAVLIAVGVRIEGGGPVTPINHADVWMHRHGNPTTSIDAAIPGEDIVRMVRVESVDGKFWYECQQSGSYGWVGKHRVEAIARRIAALKARKS